MKFLDPRIECKCREAPEHKDHYCQAEVGEDHEQGEIPSWFIKLCKEHRPENDDMPGDVDAFLRRFPGPTTWFDHVGSLKEEETGMEVLVVEPYGLTHNSFVEIYEVCKILGITVGIFATSSHYPTKTLRIIFYPPS
tara:strand:- start:1217 stop:1627 length:411 start_codon:yes stop_codon:yes gene_type:complete